ncbi:MAG: CoA transferase [Acidimicrobiales bacterium]
MELPLADLHVVDVTDDRGALCARLLSDLGARVTRVVRDPADLDRQDAVQLFRNANKDLVHLDLHDQAGADRFESLVAGADILVENLGPVWGPSHGLDGAHLLSRHPDLVHVALSDLGATGPRSDWHLEPLPAFAASGALWASGHPDMAPCWLPGFIAHDCGAVHGALGAVAAIIDHPRRGGQTIEISTQEAALAGMAPWSVVIESYLTTNPFFPAEGRRNAEATYWVLPASDGWVRVVIGHVGHWLGFVDLLGSPEALTGDEWHEGTFRIMNADVVKAIASERLVTKTRAEIFGFALDADFPIGVVQTLSEFVDHEQTQLRGFFHRTEEGDLLAAAPWHFDGAPAHQPRRPRRLEEPTGPALDRVGPSDDSEPPLAGVRVIEFGMAAVVPEMCWMLSELGADVIRIEAANHPDPIRAAGMGDPNRSFAFNTESRGRRTISIDVSTPGGRDLALELCAGADIVAENLRGGVLDRHGVGLDDVRAVNPEVIYVSSQGFGRSGPMSDLPAFGPVNAAFSGSHLLWNHPDAPYPCGSSLNHPDHIAGKMLAVAVLAALRQRTSTGQGRVIDMAQTEAGAYLLGHLFAAGDRSGIDPGPAGNSSTTQCPHAVYPAQEPDSWLAIAVTDDNQWRRLEELCGWDHDPDLATAETRVRARDEVDAKVAAWTALHGDAHAAAVLQSHGVSAMPVMGPMAHLADEHLAARDAILTLDHPAHGPERQLANPTRMGGTPLRSAGPSPCLGADTHQILADELGRSPAEIEELERSGACPPPPT